MLLWVFCASSPEEDTWKTVKGENGPAWEDGKGCKCRIEVPSSILFSVLRNWVPVYIRFRLNPKAEVDEQRSQPASVGTQAPACTHSRTEFSPFAFTSSPRGPLLFEKKIFKYWISIQQTDKSFSWWCPRACPCHLHGQARQWWGAGTWETLRNDPTQLQILCFVRVFEKLVTTGHFEHTWAVALFEKFWDLLGLRQKGESVGSWHHFQINFCMKWLGNTAAIALHLET